MVLIFSAKRRTVKYLKDILAKYKDDEVKDEEKKKKL